MISTVMGAETDQRWVSFGRFRFNPVSGELLRDGRRLLLQPQPARLLALLVGRAGEVVSRDTIRRHIWGDSVVEFDQGVNFCIRRIRMALRDNADRPRFIETIQRRGYRFTATVTAEEPKTDQEADGVEGRDSTGVARRRPAIAIAVALLVALGGLSFLISSAVQDPHERRLKLAVLPIENRGVSLEEYLTSGMTDEITNALARYAPRRLGVIARSSADRFERTERSIPEIGRELAVDYVLEGSVARHNGQMRLVFQLIQVADQTHVVADRYEHPADDLLRRQGEVAAALAVTIGETLLPDRSHGGRPARPPLPAAREAYLKGMYVARNGPAANAQSRAFFQEATRIDPDFAPAFVELASAHWNGMGDAAERVAAAGRAVQRALELDGDSAKAHRILGDIKFFHDWDWDAAVEQYQTAIWLGEDQALARKGLAVYYSAMGRHEEAIAEVRRALDLDPVSVTLNADLGWFYFRARDYREAIARCSASLELQPDDAVAQTCLIEAFTALGRVDQAAAAARRLMEHAGADLPSLAAVGQHDPGKAMAAYRSWQLAALSTCPLARAGRPVRIALAYLRQGDTDNAFAWLEEGYRGRSRLMPFLGIEPRLDALRDDPRFVDLLRRVGLSGHAGVG